jgi:anti-sigma factor RsiW
MMCETPIDAALLADYWLAALETVEEEAVEEHLFTCDECGARLREVMALSDGIRKVAREGNLLIVVTDAFLKKVWGKACVFESMRLRVEAMCSARYPARTTF